MTEPTTYVELRLVRIEVPGKPSRYAIEATQDDMHGLQRGWYELQTCATRNEALQALQRRTSDGSVTEVRTVELMAALVVQRA